MSISVLRVARPINNPAALRFYRDGPLRSATGWGLTLLTSFTAHNGFDGLMLGHPQSPYHFRVHAPGWPHRGPSAHAR